MGVDKHVEGLIRIFRGYEEAVLERRDAGKNVPSDNQREQKTERLNIAASNTQLVSSQMMVEICGLMRNLNPRKNYYDLKRYVQKISKGLGRNDRRYFMGCFTFILSEGEPLSFVSLKCVQWLCVDPKLRRCLLRETAFVTVLTNSALVSANSFDSIPDDQALFLKLSIELLTFIHEKDPYLTQNVMVRAKTSKLAVKLFDFDFDEWRPSINYLHSYLCTY